MSYRNKRLTYKEVSTVAEGFFNSAVADLQFSSGQAWAYTLDEIDSLKSHSNPKENIFVLTSVYKLALLNNVELSKDDDYTADMLSELNESYGQYSESIFDGLSMDESEITSLKSDMQLISEKYL